MADKNSLKLICPLPSLSKCFTNTATCSSFRFIPKSLRPVSSSTASSFLFLLLSIDLNIWARPLMVREPLAPRVYRMSFTRVAPSYESSAGAGIGSAAAGSVAVRIYQIFWSPLAFTERSMTAFPISSLASCCCLSLTEAFLQETSHSMPN